MAAKDKRRAGAAAGGRPLREEVDRLLARGRFKDAVKQAKLCQRQEPTAEHHRLLEGAYLKRAQQLAREGMPNAAREVAQHLLDFGLTDPALVEPAAEVLVAVGLADRAAALQGRIESPEARERLARQAADQAVLHPERAPAGLREPSARVRRALEAAAAGDEAGAAAPLRDVARGAPMADWKLFARGLAAFRRREPAEARANWERLDPARAAARAATALLSLDGAAAAAGPPEGEAAPDLEALERWAFGEPVLGPLRTLAGRLAEGRIEEAVRAVAPLRLALRRIDPGLAERLTHVLHSPVLRAASELGYREAKDLLGQFTRVAEPLALDPRWNRFWAQAWEGPQGDVEHAEEFWRKYLDDLDALPTLRPEERARARAVVAAHMGEAWLELVDDLATTGPGRGPLPAEILEARRRGVVCLEQALRNDPAYRGAYETLREAFEDWGEPERAAEADRRRLQADPEDLGALRALSRFHRHRDEPAEALEYARRARALRPLDEAIAVDEWAARVGLARHHALGGRFDAGRDELDAADRLQPERARGLLAHARRAAFELRAGQPDRAEEIIAGGRAILPEPTPLWLALRIEAARYRLPEEDQGRFEALWVAALPKKVRGDTAGALAEVVTSYLVGQIEYPGRAEHVRQVLDYLGRTTRIKYGRDDLRKACGLLAFLDGRGGDAPPTARRGARKDDAVRTLYEKLARRGTTLFRDDPVFPMMLGSIEMEKGPARGDLRKAIKHFEAARALAEARGPGDPEAVEIAARARQSLETLDELFGGPLGLPFGPKGGGLFAAIEAMMEAMGDEDFEVLDDEDFDVEDLDDDDDIDEPPPPARRPRPKSPKPQRKRRRSPRR